MPRSRSRSPRVSRLLSGPADLPSMETHAPAPAGELSHHEVVRVGGGFGIGLRADNVITQLLPGSPADLAGLKCGDLIVSVNSQLLDSPDSVARCLRTTSKAVIGVRRGLTSAQMQASDEDILTLPPLDMTGSIEITLHRGGGETKMGMQERCRILLLSSFMGHHL